LNHLLPEDIRVTAVREVPPSFDARRSALSRTYQYLVLNRPTAPAVLRGLVHHVPAPLDVEAMNRAARVFLGRRDFAAFSGALDREKQRTTIRTVIRLNVRKSKGLLVFTVEGNAFLPQQVRRMVAALIAIGTGKAETGRLQQLLSSGKLSAAAQTVPAHGLYLAKVKYKGFSIG
jgi:tRNA pseudouridine38-40 synthase